MVLVATAGTGVIQDRMTRAALQEEAGKLTLTRLQVVAAAYEDRERVLDLNLRELGERLIVHGYLDPHRSNDLEQLLGQTGSTLGIGLLGVFDSDGRFVAGQGRFLEGSELVTTQVGPGLPARLVETPDGSYRRVLTFGLGLGRGAVMGGLDYSDGVAHELARMTDQGEVFLLAGDRVVGSSIDLAPGELPGRDTSTGILPDEPQVVEVNGRAMLVAYKQLGGTGGSAPASLGVLMPDPVENLTERLTLVRLFASLVLVVVALLMGSLLFWTLVRPLVGLSKTAGRIAAGDLDATFVAPREDEIGRLALALQRMTAELQGKTRRLQETTKRLLVAQQEERQRVARDLHDGMQQQLVVLAVKLKQLASSGEAPNPLKLEHLAAEAEEAAFDLQDVGRGIFPTVLADQGVPAALRTSASRLPLPVRLEVDPELEEARLVSEIEGTLYFVAMEAMANAQKHAPESAMTIRLVHGGDEVIMEISDDGPGFDPEEQRLGSGLQNMVDRVIAVGGTASITSRPGDGVKVAARIPLGEPAPGSASLPAD